VQEGHPVSVRLKIGKMTCLEYAAMKGYADLLSVLMSSSICYESLRQYFALDGEKSGIICQVLFVNNQYINEAVGQSMSNV